MSGTYTDITELDAPDIANAGEIVHVTIKIKNIWTSTLHVYAIGVLDSESRFIDWVDGLIGPGSTLLASGSFIMPSRDVTIHAYSYYEGDDGYAHFDDSASKNISLAEVPEVFEGTITKKELDYQDIWQAVPVSDIPVDTRTRVRIWGRNDMSTNQRMGIRWWVSDPDGVVVEDYSNWETFWTGPGLEQGFVGSGFDLSKVGTYALSVGLWMNPEAPEMADFYYGDLCTVAAVVPELGFRQLEVTGFSKV